MKRLLLLWLCILGIASASFAATKWVLVTDVSELTDGTEIIFTDSGNTKGFASLSSNKGQPTTVAATTTGGETTLTSGADNCQKFRIDIVNGKYTFYALTDKGYLTQTTSGKTNISYVSSNTSTNQQATITYPSGKTAPKIRFDVETNANGANSNRIFEYYSTSDVFSTYSATDPNLHIFKKVVTEDNKCAAPIFSPAAGTYDEAQTVTLSTATDGASIYYTTDGSEPSTSSTLYSGPITVSSSQTIKAIATKSGLTDSEVATADYTINVVEPLPAGNWVRISAASELHDGDKVILTNNANTYAFKQADLDANGHGQQTVVSISTTPVDGKILLNATNDCQVFTLGISGGKYTLYANGRGYLSQKTSTGTDFEYITDGTSNQATATITSVTTGNGNTAWHFDVAESGRVIQWNNTFFGTYKSTNLNIFRLDTSVPAPTLSPYTEGCHEAKENSSSLKVNFTCPGATSVKYRINDGEWTEGLSVTLQNNRSNYVDGKIKLEVCGVLNGEDGSSTVGYYRMVIPAGDYTLVNGAGELQAGDKIIVAKWADDEYAAHTMTATNINTRAVEGTQGVYTLSTSGKSLTWAPTDAVELTLGGNATDGWFLIDAQGRYLTGGKVVSEAYNAFTFTDKYDPVASRLTIANDDDYGVKVTIGGSTACMAYSTHGSAPNRFSLYTPNGSTYHQVKWLHYHPEGAPVPTDPKYSALAPTFSPYTEGGHTFSGTTQGTVTISSVGADHIYYRTAPQGREFTDDDEYTQVEGSTATVVVRGSWQIEAYGSNNGTAGPHATALYQLSVPEGSWKKVTSTDQLAAGKKVVVVGVDKLQGMSATTSASALNGTPVTLSTSGSSVYAREDAAEWVLEGDATNGWLLRTVDGRYLYNPSDDNVALTDDLSSVNADNYTLGISLNADGNAVVMFGSNTTNSLRHFNNATYNSFKLYTSTGNSKPITLFVIDGVEVAAQPSFTPAGGATEAAPVAVDNGSTVTISSDNNATAIYWRKGAEGSFTKVEGKTATVTIDADGELQAYAINADGVKTATTAAWYALNRPAAAPAVTGVAAGTSVAYNSAVTISCPGAPTIKYRMSVGNVEGEVMTLDGNTIYLDRQGEVTLTVWGEIAGAAGPATTLTFTVEAPTVITYTLVKGNEDGKGLPTSFTAGTKFVIAVNGKFTYKENGNQHDEELHKEAMATTMTGTGTNTVRDSKAVTINGDKLELQPGNITVNEGVSSQIEVLTLRGSAGAWYFETHDGKYLSSASTGNCLLTVDDNTSDNTKITGLDIAADGKATINFKSGSSKNLRWNLNIGNPRFTCYSSNPTATNIYPYIYALESEGASVANPTITVTGTPEGGTGAYADYYNNAVQVTLGCLTAGATVEYSTDGENWTTYDFTTEPKPVITINADNTTLNVRSTKADMTPGAAARTFHFRAAKPTITVEENVVLNTKKVYPSCQTLGAELYYRIDVPEAQKANDDNWTAYMEGDGIAITSVGEHEIEIKAALEGYVSRIEDFIVKISDPTASQNFVIVTPESTPLAAGDEIIIVAKDYDYSMAAYTSGSYFAPVAISRQGTGSNEYITLSADQTSVEVFTLEASGSLWLLNASTSESGYLNCPKGKNSLNVVSTAVDNSKAAITIDSSGTVIQFTQSEDDNSNQLQYNSNSGSLRFSCYSGTQQPVVIYRATTLSGRVARPTATPYEGIYSQDELPGNVVLACATEGATIWYTTDGTDPRTNNEKQRYIPGTTTIDPHDCQTIRAYASKEGMYDSHDLIATYHVYKPGRVYTRVTPAEVQNLAVGDEVIVVASPTDSPVRYALGRNQVDLTNPESGKDEKYREAVALTTVPDENGRLTLGSEALNVQPLMLLSGMDEFDNFDWRLYASGSALNGTVHANRGDGYLYSGGANYSLETMRVENANQAIIANTDLRFHSAATSKLGNEYGGVTVQFNSPDGHDETYPNYLGLRHMPDGTWRFNCYTTEYIADNSTEIYYVSLFKAYDPDMVAPPTFTPDGGQTVAEAIDESETISLDYVDLGYGSTTNRTIKYAIDPTIADPSAEVTVESISSWQTYTEPFYFDSGLHTVYAYLEIDDPATSTVKNSPVVKRIYSASKEEIFELVTTGTTIKESDRLIFVNNIPYDGVSDHDYYAMTTVTYGSDTHWIGRKINEAPSGDGQPRRLRVPAPVAGEEHPIAIFNVELDGSGSKSSQSRPYLIRLGDKYLEATKAKGLQLTELKPIEERDKMNCGFSVVDAHVADSTMDPDGYSGDFLYYLRKDADTPTTTRGNVDNKAVVVFSGFVDGDTILTTLRFVGTGNYRHFNNYEYKEKKVKVDGKEIIWNKPNDYTYPVSIYRATESVMPPSLTVYPLDFEASREQGTDVFSDKGYSTDVTTFYNPVKIVIKDNPKTAGNASMKYAWTKTREAAPVSSEYTKAPTKPVTMVLDGFSLTINGAEATDWDGTAVSAAGTAYMSTAIRAMSELNGVVSPSVPHAIHFKTAAPKLTVESTDGTTKIVRVDRPEVYTLGSVLRYTLDGTNPTESTESVVLPGETIEVPAGQTLKVGAFKPGFETQIATYSQYTYTPQAKAVQLLELTSTGRLTAEGEYDYMTYRTSGNNYFIKKDGTNLTLTLANDKFEQIIAEPGNYNWTADYYVFAANKDDFDALTDGVAFDEGGELKIKIGSDVVEKKVDAVASEANLDGTTANYYGAILNRSGALGQDNITVDMTYSIDGKLYNPSALTRVKPEMPMPTDLKYTYDTEEYSTVGDYTDDVTIGSHSAVLNDDVDLVFPAIFNGRSNFSPRALTCLYNFRKPNVAADVLKDYDLQYSVVITNSYTLNYKHQGTQLYNSQTGKWTLPADFADIMANNPDLLYIEKTMFDITTDGQNQYYALRIDKVTPSDDVNPVIQIADTKYVSKEDASSDDASYDYGAVKALEAESAFDEGARDAASDYAPKFGRIYLTPVKNPLGTYDWYYFGHPKHDDRGKSELGHPGASQADVVIEPSLYHLEVYVEDEDGGIERRPDDSFKPSYLHDRDYYYGGLNHKVLLYDPDNWNCYYVNEKDDDDNYNSDYEKNHALLGQVVMYNVPGDKTLKAVLTPVYVFQRDPKERLTLNEGDTYTPLYEAGTMGGGANKPSGAMSAPRHAPRAVDPSSYVVLRGTPMRSTSAVDDGTTGVENVIDNADARAEYYTIQGVRVENPGPGLYIEVRDSKARKVLLK